MSSGSFYIILVLTSLSNLSVKAQSTSGDSIPRFTPEVSYTGNVVGNLSGGIRRGACYLGMLNVKLTTRLWKGANLLIYGANTHGEEPSAELIGDYQIASNIEAGDHTYIQELWFDQSWSNGGVTIGLQDLNVNFANTAYGTLFFNSSFGILPTISANVPAPVFPLTSLGISTRWNLSKKITLHAAVFDGEPTDFADNPNNLNWHLSRNDGILIFTELQRVIALFGHPGIIKSGVYLHQHFSEPGNDDQAGKGIKNGGFYFIAEQELWQTAEGKKHLGMFLQAGISPMQRNSNTYYVGIGTNITGILNRNGKDVLGLAIAHAGLEQKSEKETVIELSYQLTLIQILYLQPDIQYIINPSGTGQKLDNCLVAMLRFGVKL